MRIGGLLKFSLIDYPGKMSAVIFTQGCNFRCPFCHNPELVLPSSFRVPMSVESVLSFLSQRAGSLEGVVVTGGEPTIHQDLPEFLGKIKDLGYDVKLDTNGSHPQMVRKLMAENLVDFWAMDLKASWEKYPAACGINVDVDKIRESWELIIHSGVAHQLRTTLVKRFHPREELPALSAIGRQGERYVLQSFVPREDILDPALLGEDRYSPEDVVLLQEMWGK